jgi:hypothetical protein
MTKTKTKTDMIIRADGSPIIAVAPKQSVYSLEELHEHTNSEWITVTRAPFYPGMVIVLDDEGLLNRKPYNDRASQIAGVRIVGDVLVCRLRHVN